jgi:predicted HAD superfamily Cof-like phosphohydrolase
MSYQAFESVKEFLQKNGHLVQDVDNPAPLPITTMLLRERLMLEELGELASACHEEDLEKIADGMCDLLYVVLGTGVSFGVPVKCRWLTSLSESAKVAPTVVTAQYLAVVCKSISDCVELVARNADATGQYLNETDTLRVMSTLGRAVRSINDFSAIYFIELGRCFCEVHRANMSKNLGGATDGKKYGTSDAKGEGFQPPNLRPILGLS